MKHSIQLRAGRIISRIEDEYRYAEMTACFAQIADRVALDPCSVLILDIRAMHGGATDLEKRLLANYIANHIPISNIIFALTEEQNTENYFEFALITRGRWVKKVTDDQAVLRLLCG